MNLLFIIKADILSPNELVQNKKKLYKL